MNGPELIPAVREFEAAQFAVVPVRPDGSKVPAAFWKTYRSRRPTLEQLGDWFGPGIYDGLGIICGAVSGGVEMLEMEGRALAEGYQQRLAAALADHGLTEVWQRITRGYAERTPSGGVHVLYRVVDGPVRPNTKLARRPSTPEELDAWKTRQQADVDTENDDARRERRQRALDRITSGEQVPQVLIETRGEGGFVVVAPSGGRTHPSGRPWRLVSGGPAHLATITATERDALFAVAELLDSVPAPSPPAPRPRRSGDETGGPRPGDDFNAKADWTEILEPHGWRYMGPSGPGALWCRPGKSHGISATTGTRGDGDCLYVFSTSTLFEAEQPYSKFAAFTLLEYGGDYQAAARYLARRGYGEQRPPRPVPAPRPATLSGPAAAREPVAGRRSAKVLTGLVRAVLDSSSSDAPGCLLWAAARVREHAEAGLFTQTAGYAALRTAARRVGLPEDDIDLAFSAATSAAPRGTS